MTDKTHISLSLILFFGIFGIAFLFLGVPSLLDHISLRQSETIAEACVTDSDVGYERLARYGNPAHRIRYVLVLNGVDVTRSDFLGRTNLWSEIPKDVWQVATATKRIIVRYDPANPSNNAPACSLPNIWDAITLLGLGTVCLCLALALGWKRIKAGRN